MRAFDPQKLTLGERTNLLQSGVAPRPVALVSTVSPEGRRNLSPFSFFNLFGLNPATVCFSPSRRGRDGSLKDTYNNLVATKECVIQAVTHAMVRQVSLASTEYGPDVDEFVKSGLTPVPAELVKPARVGESPFQMECALRQMIPLGEGPGSGNLAVCEVLRVHVAEDVLVDGLVAPDRIDLVARMGADLYARASGAALFKVAKPLRTRGLGVDLLPERIRTSRVLTGNDLGQLANVERLPSPEEVRSFVAGIEPGPASEVAFWRHARAGEPRRMLACALALAAAGDAKAATLVELAAQKALALEDVDFAWKALLGAPRA